MVVILGYSISLHLILYALTKKQFRFYSHTFDSINHSHYSNLMPTTPIAHR